MQIERVEHFPLVVPLREPFVIASARMDATCATLVRVTMRDGERVAVGYGEAAPLPPVTEDAETVRSAVVQVARRHSLPSSRSQIGPDLQAISSKVARAGVESAILDATARLSGVSVASLLAGRTIAPITLETDVTLPIADPDHMVDLARGWHEAGFTRFKVKVGKDLDSDVRALRGVNAAIPGARFRLDANEGFTAREAISLIHAIDDLYVECFEQPCKRDDLGGMAEVARAIDPPVIADESLRSMADFDRILEARAADGVNLKLVKLGGLRLAYEIGLRARAEKMPIMCGAMVETRLGLVAMAHVAAALGGVALVDLDTAFLLASDPFAGGWTAKGPVLQLSGGLGLDVRPIER
ncbi:MAG: mandelate racemase/muconate lactonizing enzyme family protein [Polyangiales bacterium]